MLSIILPVGISFYTFQSMSYTIDVYRGDMKAHRGFLVFLATLSFFPQLVAGPILRAKEILPQLVNMRVPTALNIRIGLLLVLLGLLKKTTADLMAGPVGVAFNGQTDVSTFETWIGLLAFSA
jgi:D-alanyl-lipoteichoic acid acyltransferase DltB (MBOAT superfamily)